MCLAIPARVVSIQDNLATVEINGVQRDVSTMLLPETQVDDHVLVHAGFVMQKITPEDAATTNALLEEMRGGDRKV